MALIEAAPALDGSMEHMYLIKIGDTGNRTTMEDTKIVPKCTEEGAMLASGMITPATTMERLPLSFARSP